ncbi:MAG: iron ABC transporter permease, partial [Desulfobacterales bacterium]|nr:iron ABC transporter permease [Desulfobacterales bacterium]
LGVAVEQVRLSAMVGASFVTAVVIAHVGVIGFIGLVAPHMVRRLVGEDHRFLLPGAVLAGGLILLISDTTARLILLPHVLPVSIFTAFLGAPIFIWLIIKNQGGTP